MSDPRMKKEAYRAAVNYVNGNRSDAYAWIGNSANKLVMFLSAYGVEDGGGTQSKRRFLDAWANRYWL